MTYQPRPLPQQISLIENIEVDVQNITANSNPNTSHYEVNPADGLDLTEVGIIAVVGNRDLRTKRAELKLVGAQAFAAGLLPDPQLSFNLDKPTSNMPDLVNAWGLGLGYDILPLITRQSRINAERGTETKVALELLWQEWQVIQQARTLAVRYIYEEQRLKLLADINELFQHRYQQSFSGMNEGNITVDVNGIDLTALLDSFTQISEQEQQHNQTRHDLNLLLGLQADVDIKLATLPSEPVIDDRQISSQLEKLSDIRPDLLALKAGYESQEERLRTAILAQFPSFSIGISRARDNSNLYTSGISIGLNIPLFDRNRGNIAIQRATRGQLYEEYIARMVQTRDDVDRLLQLQHIVEKQRSNLQTYLPKLQKVVDDTRQAYNRGDISALTFINMEDTLLNKRLEQINIQQTRWENLLALQALMALPEASSDLPIPSIKEDE